MRLSWSDVFPDTVDIVIKKDAIQGMVMTVIGGSVLTPVFDNVSVLVVEPCILNQVLLVEQLGQLGCKYSIAKNGLDALMLLKVKRYDITLAALNMPAMDGFELAGKIRLAEDGVDYRSRIIALIADDSDEQYGHCLKAGMDDVLAMPSQTEMLCEIVMRYTRLSQRVRCYRRTA